jgi:prevent-host-death family protein
MEQIPDTMAVSEARANLSEVVNTVRLQDRAVRLERRGIPQAAVVPVDILDLIEEVGGLDDARSALRRYNDPPSDI